MRTPAGVRHLWVHFTPSWPGRPRGGGPWAVPISPALRALAAELGAALAEPGASVHHRARALLHAVFARLEPGLFPTYPAPLARLLEEVQADPGREASVPALARRVGMSRSRFAAWFRAHLGQAPATWVRQVRVDHAARLLCLGDDSLEQIAAAAGFPNRFHFTRVFTAFVGLPPAAYRKRHRRVGIEP
jgi:transcriptional regulator GlxA family with amidase domain